MQIEVFNILFVMEHERKHLVYCLACALKTSPGLAKMAVLQQYHIKSLAQVYDNFVLAAMPPSSSTLAAATQHAGGDSKKVKMYFTPLSRSLGRSTQTLARIVENCSLKSTLKTLGDRPESFSALGNQFDSCRNVESVTNRQGRQI